MQPDQGLPKYWKPEEVAVGGSRGRPFLFRPHQLLVAREDADAARRALEGWQPMDDGPRPEGVVVLTRTSSDVDTDPEAELRQALERLRRVPSDHRDGPVRAAPNHVFVGEAEAAIDVLGQPRIQGGPGSSVRPAAPPEALPELGQPGDGEGVTVAVLDTGLFEHRWLTDRIERALGSDDVWDENGDRYADAEAGHGTFIAGLVRQVAPAATVHAVKVLDSWGVGDDAVLATAMEQLPEDVQIVNLSLGGYTDGDEPPLAITTALRVLRARGATVLAAAGNAGDSRLFWPAAFKGVLGIGCVEEADGGWRRAPFSNHGWWVDACARGVGIESTFHSATTLVHDGSDGSIGPQAADPEVTFDGWAAWDGTSFSTPVVAGVIARELSRAGGTAEEAKARVLSRSPLAPQPDFPLGLRIDDESV